MHKVSFIILSVLFALNIPLSAVEKSDWFLYVWSEEVSGDLGQFEMTDQTNNFYTY